ncbi:MAG: hypothetical protein JEY96_18950 [Bacteroidales bacterium]|nr:hypothetical protein [Bacteroidales bacterium]
MAIYQVIKMEKYKYIFSLLISLLAFSYSFAQDDEFYADEKVKEPLLLKGIKFGVNVGRFSDFQFKPDRSSYEASFDFNLNNKYFGVIEGGYSEIAIEKDKYNLNSEGTFIKIGFDYNMLKKWPTDFLGIGLRIGRSDFSQSADNIEIDLNHWGNYSSPSITKSFDAYWFEASFGVKGEIFKNIYLGWAGIVRVQLSGGKDADFQPYDIPGYGTGSKSLHLAVNYYIYYQIPFNRK